MPNFYAAAMKDRILLVVAALAIAPAAWAFWHFLDSDAHAVLLLLALVALSAENHRLRRALRSKEPGG